MKRAVYKYLLQVANSQTLMLPEGAQILSVQEQHGDVQLWALVDTSRELTPRYIAIHGTGHEVYDGDLTHISTFQMRGGSLVFHAFEFLPEREPA